MPVMLYTAAGGFVTEEMILPFTTYPDVILWGSRAFMRRQENIYYECFYCVIPSPGFWTTPVGSAEQPPQP